MSEIQLKKQEAEQVLKEDLIKLLTYYEKIFNESQIEALVLFWYGMTPYEVSKELQVDAATIATWFHDKMYDNAVRMGENRRKELISIKMDKLSNRAMRVIENTLSHDIEPNQRGFKEYITTARWVIDKTHVPLTDSETSGESGKNTSKVDAETIRILAEEMRNSTPDDLMNMNVADLYKLETVESKSINLSRYYTIVESKRAMVSHGNVNVYVPKEIQKAHPEDEEPEQEDVKIQCHLCGKWYVSLGSHVTSTHSPIDIVSYRAHFSLPETLPLTADEKLISILKEK